MPSNRPSNRPSNQPSRSPGRLAPEARLWKGLRFGSPFYSRTFSEGIGANGSRIALLVCWCEVSSAWDGAGRRRGPANPADVSSGPWSY